MPRRCCCCAHFTEEEAEALEVKWLAQGTQLAHDSLRTSPGSLAPEPRCSPTMPGQEPVRAQSVLAGSVPCASVEGPLLLHVRPSFPGLEELQDGVLPGGPGLGLWTVAMGRECPRLESSWSPEQRGLRRCPGQPALSRDSLVSLHREGHIQAGQRPEDGG